MANLIFTTDSTGTGIQGDMGADLNSVTYVASDVSVLSVDDTVLTGTGGSQSYQIAGYVSSFAGTGIDMDGDSNALTVLGTGSVIGNPTYVGTEAVRIGGNSGLVNNYGLISGHTGINIAGGEFEINNHGLISGEGLAGSSDPAVGINISVAAGFASAAEGIIRNDGVISGADFSINSTLAPDGAVDAIALLIYNYGTLNGAVKLNNLDDAIANYGFIVGDVEMGGGEDVFFARVGGEVLGTVYGENGNDVLYGSTGDDNLNGGNDNDVLIGKQGDDNILGGNHDDFIQGGAGDDNLEGENGADSIYGNRGDDYIEGGNGKDFLSGGRDNDTIYGGAKEDFLKGGLGDDILDGGDGNDQLNGGKGDDMLSGNSGADTFIFDRLSGNDVILDYDATDSIWLRGLNVGNFTDLVASGALIDTGTNTVVDLTLVGGDGVILIENTTVGSLDSSDFVF